jgi:ADP-ribosylglycohydrolase
MLDALGAPAESRKYFSFPLITTMIPNVNFLFPPGVWTDQTSMTLCLAHSLATYNSPISATQGGFYKQDQLDAYADWLESGVLSATGSCAGVGGTIRFIVGVYINDCHHPEKQLQETHGGVVDGVNEGLMGVLPAGLVYW